jgi:hemerythrin superfamily protein
MDAIQLVRRDHRAVGQIFARLERAERERHWPEKRRAVRDLVRELSVHASIEEQFLYPALRVAGVEPEVLAALEEHHLVKVTLAELERMDARTPRFAPKVRLLAASVRAHVEEEERELLPRLEAALGPEQLRELGDTLETAKRAAPTRPHPGAPDTPPANFIAGALAAVVDRTRDALRGGIEVLRLVVERTVARGSDAAHRLAARVNDRQRVARDLRRRGRALIGAARETATGVVELGEEALDEARGRARDARGRVEEGARRVQEGSREAARELRDRGRSVLRGHDGEPRREASCRSRRPRRRGTKRRR